MTMGRFTLSLVASLFASSALGAGATGIEGRWLTFDAGMRTKRSTVEIFGEGDRVYGRIADLHVKPGEDADPVCDLCQGPERGRRIRGLRILSLEREAETLRYVGKVLDPEEGKTYRCIVTLDADGKRLSLRGYVGIPLVGRTETWVRAE